MLLLISYPASYSSNHLVAHSTLLSSLSNHLTTLETISQEHLRLADSLTSQVIDEYRKSSDKKESTRKKVGLWVEGVDGERERAIGEVGRAMNKVSAARVRGVSS